MDICFCTLQQHNNNYSVKRLNFFIFTTVLLMSKFYFLYLKHHFAFGDIKCKSKSIFKDERTPTEISATSCSKWRGCFITIVFWHKC